jgi:NitT/TauT family transport system ATP-binding protein
MIAWGRYAGLMDYSAKSGLVFVPQEEPDPVEEAGAA